MGVTSCMGCGSRGGLLTWRVCKRVLTDEYWKTPNHWMLMKTVRLLVKIYTWTAWSWFVCLDAVSGRHSVILQFIGSFRLAVRCTCLCHSSLSASFGLCECLCAKCQCFKFEYCVLTQRRQIGTAMRLKDLYKGLTLSVVIILEIIICHILS